MLWRGDEHEAGRGGRWDEQIARDAIRAIVSDAETAERDGFWPGHPLDNVGEDERMCSLYLGSAGMVWALWKLDSDLDAAAAIAPLIERYRADPDFGRDAHRPSLLMGETGLQVVAIKLGSPASDREVLRRLVTQNRRHPSRELMWGSPGTMLAAKACGLTDEWMDSARLLWAGWEASSGVWTQEMYGEIRQYLGPVHGFAGNVHALRGYGHNGAFRERVGRLTESTALRADGLVNWPPSLREAASRIRVQWCHGAPGIVTTIGDLIPRKLAIGGGELSWRAGPLRKGPGLCHGTAGNGFTFLRLYELTSDRRWLDRARRFAMHAIGQVARQRARFGRGRYTLWTGDIGVALYLKACLEADASFPILDTF